MNPFLTQFFLLPGPDVPAGSPRAHGGTGLLPPPDRRPDSAVCTVRLRHGEDAPTAVVISALGVSMSEPRYLWSILARQLHARGMNVLQYDHPGQGDSTVTGRPADWRTARETARTVVSLGRETGAGPVLLVGYGLGCLLAADLLGRGEADAGVLVCPDVAAWLAAADDEETLSALERQRWLPPDTVPRPGTAADLVDAVVGEPYQPAQPAGRLPGGLLADAARTAPGAFASLRGTRTLVIAAGAGDRAFAREHGLPVRALEHSPTPWAPSWHWESGPRERVIEAVTAFATGADGAAPSPPGGRGGSAPASVPAVLTGSVKGPDGSRISSVAFDSDGETLLGVLHEPPGTGPWPLCLVYEPGNPGQRVDIHECGPALAHAAASHGVPVLRYDSRGTGVSDGVFTHTTWARRLEDLRAAVAHLRTAGVAERFVVVGNSAGARLAAMAAADLPEIAGSVLWGPILVEEESQDGPAPRLHRVDGTLAAAWCGLWLGVAYTRDDRDRDYFGLLKAAGRPVCTVYGDEELDSGMARALLAETDRRPGWEAAVVEGSHGFTAAGLAAAVDISVDWAVRLGRGAPAPAVSAPERGELP